MHVANAFIHFVLDGYFWRTAALVWKKRKRKKKDWIQFTGACLLFICIGYFLPVNHLFSADADETAESGPQLKQGARIPSQAHYKYYSLFM